ncbi:MAG TPA: serine/threonine-protein kinase [Polyangiaceae bacterium]|nr:serine/threonine-protein kinase [Polyangiaceae bacterium]
MAAEATIPPSSRSTERACPRCRKPRSAFPGLVVNGNELPRCPDHALPFVDLRDGSDPLLGTTIAGRFTILGRLGRGSMGAVYRARQEAVGRDVALKLVRQDRAHDPETKGRFEREARAISALVSPHTVTAFDFGEAEDGSWFLAMEMLEGETVGDRLRRVGRLDWFDALRFTRDALVSLAEAHAKGIIHRDLKPDNLFLSRVLSSGGGVAHESCKVLDFGIAKWSRDDDASKIDQLETQAGTVFGTPRYMSPEQAQGTPLDARSDLYSLGVLLYQMLSGRAPFVDDDAVVVMARHIKDPPPRFETMKPEVKVPESIAALLWRVLSKSPAERPATAEQMIAELDAAEISVRALESGPRLTFANPQKTLFHRYGGWFVAGALALFSLGLLVVFGQRKSAPSSTSASASSIHAVSGSELQSHAAQEPAPAPLLSLNTAENSALEPAPEPAPSASNLPAAKKVPRPHNSLKAPLRKKGNERYGRFE